MLVLEMTHEQSVRVEVLQVIIGPAMREYAAQRAFVGRAIEQRSGAQAQVAHRLDDQCFCDAALGGGIGQRRRDLAQALLGLMVLAEQHAIDQQVDAMGRLVQHEAEADRGQTFDAEGQVGLLDQAPQQPVHGGHERQRQGRHDPIDQRAADGELHVDHALAQDGVAERNGKENADAESVPPVSGCEPAAGKRAGKVEWQGAENNAEDMAGQRGRHAEQRPFEAGPLLAIRSAVGVGKRRYRRE